MRQLTDHPLRLPQERLQHLKQQCQPQITEAAKQSVEAICLKVYNLSADYAKKIHEKHWELLRENNITGQWARVMGRGSVVIFPDCSSQ